MAKHRINRNAENKKFEVLMFLLVLVLVAGSILGIVIYRSTHTPKAKVMFALSKTFGQNSVFAIMSDNESRAGNGTLWNDYLQDFIQGKKILDAVLEGNFSSCSEFTLEELDYPGMTPEMKYLHGAGLRFSHDLMREQALSRQKLELRYNSATLLGINAYADENVISIASDDYLDGYISFEPFHLGEIYNDSLLATLLQKQIPDEYVKLLSFHPLSFPDKTNPGSIYRFVATAEGIDALLEFYNEICVEEIDDTEVISIAGREEICSIYQVIFPADAFSDFLTSYYDWAEDDFILFLEENEDIVNALTFLIRQQGGNVSGEKEIARFILQEPRHALSENEEKDIQFQVFLRFTGELVQLKFRDDFAFHQNYYELDTVITWHGAPNLTDKIDFCAALSSEQTKYEFFCHQMGESQQAERLEEIRWQLTRNNVLLLSNEQSNTFDFQTRELKVNGNLTIPESIADSFPDQFTDLLPEQFVDALPEPFTDSLPDYFAPHFPASLVYETAFAVDNNTKENQVSFYVDDCILQFITPEFQGTIGFSAKTEFAMLSDTRIDKPEGPEYRIFEMNPVELFSLGNEIYNNVKNSFLYELIQNI
ncbi:MAG: hypothetical protein ACI4DU_11005 [Lachnospiraceae bacterium]